MDEASSLAQICWRCLASSMAYPPLSAHDLDHTFSSSDSSLDAYPSDSNAMGSRPATKREGGAAFRWVGVERSPIR